MLGLVKPISVAVNGDAAEAAEEITKRLSSGNMKIAAHGTREQRLEEVRKQKKDWENELTKLSSGEGSPISPRRALRELEKAMPKNAMVTTDIGNVCSVSNSYLRFDSAPSFFAAMSFGNCGYAFPTAIGAKVARPDRPAIAYVGDGAWGMSLAEVLTCVREEIPVTAVVFNNGQWGAEKKNQVDYYADRYIGTNLKNPSFAGIAKAMGAEGITVSHPGEVGDALRQATASNRCTVLELMLTQELGDPFRRDALKKPKRLLPKYADYTVE
jgi:sulfoacetaldehyde acetyltransferase